MSEQQHKVEEKNVLRKIANLMAVSYLYDGSVTLLDRMSNALSKDIAIKALYDAERIVETGIRNQEIILFAKSANDEDEGKEKKYIIVKSADKSYIIYGSLPTGLDIEEFFSLLDKNIRYARKAGALAIGIARQAEMYVNNQEGEQ